MQPLKAHVRDGRLVLEDAATDLPEGTEVDLAVVDDDDFEPAERAALLRALEAAEGDVEAGATCDGFELIARLRGTRAAAGSSSG